MTYTTIIKLKQVIINFRMMIIRLIKCFYFPFLHICCPMRSQTIYLKSNVLKPGGLCLSTFFIYNSKNEEKIINNGTFSFPFDKGNYKLMSDEVKSANIALKEKFLEKIILDTGLRRLKTIDGFWKIGVKNQKSNEFQDIIIMEA